MRSIIPFILTAATCSLGATSSANEFNELSLRTIKFSPYHVERLPLAAIERLRTAEPLPRPLTSESLNDIRASLSDISSLTGSTISDEAIEQLQGRFQRKLWGPGYIDVTDSVAAGFEDSSQAPLIAPVATPEYPTPDPSAHPELEPMLKMVNSTELREYVTHLSTAYRTRYYRHPHAREPTLWIEAQFASWLGVNQTTVVENKFNQPNIIGRIEPKSRNSSAPIIILGAHLDSTSQIPWVAPGADDDASGLSVVMAIMRILKANNYQGNYAIEAHAYAGEEGGLLGSDALARSYKDQGKEVRGMLEFEMVGYQPPTSTNKGKSSTITVLADPVPGMTSHMLKVVEAYVPTAERRSVNCGYGCSDHYSFFGEGYPVVCLASYGPNDKYLNPNYHAMSDTADKLDFEKMTDFVRAGLAWILFISSHPSVMLSLPILLLAFSSTLSVQAAPAAGFEDLSVRAIQFASGHVERLPLAAIERLRTANPLPRPLTPESFIAARKSLADISILTASVISDEAIDRLQGHFQRKIWGPGYVDVTDLSEDLSRRSLTRRVDAPAYPAPDPSAQPELESMFEMINSSELKSLNAREPAEWIRSQFASWLGQEQVRLAENSFNQPNVVGRIEAKSGDPNAPIVILGAHLDSTSQTPMIEAPGADDDASGVAVVMSIMRILKANNYKGTYAIEAHAYAGEEGGYQPATATNAGKSSTITVLSDPVPQMSDYMAQIVQKYVPTAEQRSVPCGYGCSDHYSFYDQGYPVVCIASYGPNDSQLNPGYHTTNDTVEKLDFDKMSDFVRAGLAWVVEVTA
ncbi:bacterial leucyl aminopeptidase [Rhizoctonia solani]|uniref:Peptide hydrolase n=1 Tax=Rhizoctonia solani TaxID=456999 RepID=A0A0K6FLT9_9AGAM|nr:bacterial leucyl aminopeptidase [Rhizoctonia solani]